MKELIIKIKTLKNNKMSYSYDFVPNLDVENPTEDDYYLVSILDKIVKSIVPQEVEE